MRDRIPGLLVAIGSGSVIMFLSFWTALEPWNWLGVGIVCLFFGLRPDLIPQPFVRRRVRNLLLEWQLEELKSLLEERKRQREHNEINQPN